MNWSDETIEKVNAAFWRSQPGVSGVAEALDDVLATIAESKEIKALVAEAEQSADMLDIASRFMSQFAFYANQLRSALAPFRESSND